MPDHPLAEATAVANEVRKSVEPRVQRLTDPENRERDFLFVPKEFTLHGTKKLLDEWRTAPERRTGVCHLTELDSFIAHTKRFCDPDSAMFADRSPGSPSLLTVFDYHRIGAEASPRFGTHRAKYAFPLAQEWLVWTGQNGQPMSQEMFAAWIEDHLVDVADPSLPGKAATKFAELLSCKFASASTLLGLSRGLSVHVGQKIANHQNLATGEATVSFVEAHSDASGAPVKIPGAFLLAIPPFRGGAPYEIPTRLRYRVRGAEITWFYEMHGVQRILDDAIDEACERATKETALPLYAGTPEA
jgi:uncharacterized protein YfdQ (DUF2303 family)